MSSFVDLVTRPGIMLGWFLVTGSLMAAAFWMIYSEDRVAQKTTATITVTLDSGEQVTGLASGYGALCAFTWAGDARVRLTLPSGDTVNGTEIRRVSGGSPGVRNMRRCPDAPTLGRLPN